MGSEMCIRDRDRAICGASSGGISAFTAAWERPAAFGEVYSMIGSFTNIRGGNIYPSWIRKTAPKPIKVFLEGGENDLNNSHGDWPLGNLQMAAALKHMNWDYLFHLYPKDPVQLNENYSREINNFVYSTQLHSTCNGVN